jgi:ABC-type molybdenum transport system ATPase subunit/photorepair protein PhrA
MIELRSFRSKKVKEPFFQRGWTWIVGSNDSGKTTLPTLVVGALVSATRVMMGSEQGVFARSARMNRR